MENNKNINDEIEIDLKDIMGYCFLHLRSALIICISSFLIFGMYKYYSILNKNNNTNNNLNNNETTDLINEDITEEKIEAINTIVENLDTSFLQQKDYLDNSLLMQINPNNIYTSQSEILISANQNNNTPVYIIAQTIEDNILNGKEIDTIALNYSTTPNYIRELIDISHNSINNSKSNNNNNLTNNKKELLTINVKSPSKTDSESIMNSLVNSVMNMNNLKSELGQFTINELVRLNTIASDNDLANLQNTNRQNLINLQTNIDTYNKTLESLSKDLSDNIIPTTEKAQKEGLKYGFIGLIGSFLMYGFILCIKYITSKRPITNIQFNQFNLFDLGSFYKANKSLYKKKSKFDIWLRKAMNIDNIPANNVINMIGANLNTYYKEYNKLLITGSSSKDDKEQLVIALNNKYKNIKFYIADDIVNNAYDRELINKVNGAILYENFQTCTYKNITETINLLNKANIKILGKITK